MLILSDIVTCHSPPRLNHTERDLSQKRVLVEDLKFKVKVAQENASTDTEVMVGQALVGIELN